MKKIVIFITTLLLLQGCSSKEVFTTEQLQNLTNSVKFDQLKKTEFNVSENKLVITTDEEVINEDSFNNLLNSLKITNLSGKILDIYIISSKEFDNKNFNIEVVTKNNNSVSFNTGDSDNKKFNITNKKYSTEYIKNKITMLSNNLVNFDELAGTIETDLNKGRNLGDKVAKFTEVSIKISSEIKFLKLISSENSQYDKISELSSKLDNIEKLTSTVANAVDSSVSSKNGTAISAVFLSINDIDKLARELPNL